MRLASRWLRLNWLLLSQYCCQNRKIFVGRASRPLYKWMCINKCLVVAPYWILLKDNTTSAHQALDESGFCFTMRYYTAAHQNDVEYLIVLSQFTQNRDRYIKEYTNAQYESRLTSHTINDQDVFCPMLLFSKFSKEIKPRKIVQRFSFLFWFFVCLLFFCY